METKMRASVGGKTEERYQNVIGDLDLTAGDDYMEAKLDAWDYPGEAVNVLIAGKVWVTITLEQAKNLQRELNNVFK